jgi:hypothetical protein
MDKVNFPIIFTVLSATFIILSQSLSFNPKTGDEKLDAKLAEINLSASQDIKSFIERVNQVYHIEENQVKSLLEIMETG